MSTLNKTDFWRKVSKIGKNFVEVPDNKVTAAILIGEILTLPTCRMFAPAAHISTEASTNREGPAGHAKTVIQWSDNNWGSPKGHHQVWASPIGCQRLVSVWGVPNRLPVFGEWFQDMNPRKLICSCSCGTLVRFSYQYHIRNVTGLYTGRLGVPINCSQYTHASKCSHARIMQNV